jgi:hypothetical protein
MQYTQIPCTEWIKSFSYSNGINNHPILTNIDYSSPSVTDRKSPDIYQLTSKVLISINF